MNQKAAETLDYLLTTPLGFYQKADMLVRLLTRENVGAVMAGLPRDLYDEFLQFAREVYLPEGERLTIGSPLPEESLAVIREWVRHQARAGA